MSYHSLTTESGGDHRQRAMEAEKLLELIGEDTDQLAPNEQKFVADLKERFERYGLQTTVSTKQLFWLRDIKDRLI